ncbi:MAG: GNAT family N-acetyltransferase [Myxococcota bacterium]|nr:GNAT family N-acetyltransferase [Myxococcota bacterium]
MGEPLPTQEMPPRRCIALHGTSEETSAYALALIALIQPAHCLWVSEERQELSIREGKLNPTPRSRLRRQLGASYEVVVLDLHVRLDPDQLGQAQGLILGGGSLVLRLPPRGEAPTDMQAMLEVLPLSITEVGLRFYRRFEASLTRWPPPPTEPLSPLVIHPKGGAEQRELISQLLEVFQSPTPCCAVLIADRGRGKSSALGIALARYLASYPEAEVIITGAQAASCGELYRAFERTATSQTAPPFQPIEALLTSDLLGEETTPLIVIDEAAQIPVPLLQRLVQRAPMSSLAFATTTRGYEGTGRGFVLRFLLWLERWLNTHKSSLERLSLREPIRWGSDDPLERWLFDALLLDAEPAKLDQPSHSADALEFVSYDRDTLVKDERSLKAIFGLLIHAHYRTTPGDLHRILDAPNLRLHALRGPQGIEAVTLVAIEGDLPPSLSAAVYHGERRLRGQAIPELLISHAGHPEAASLSMLRSVRIATHPARRRQGLGRRLVEAVHDHYQPALFGTLFGATSALVAFREALDYQLVRVGASRGSRTGEPSVLMLSPRSEAASALVRVLRGELARELPLQLSLLETGPGRTLNDTLRQQLLSSLPTPTPASDSWDRARLGRYAFSSLTLEGSAGALERFLSKDPEASTDPSLKPLRDRVCQQVSWEALSGELALSIPATMRLLRRRFRAHVERRPQLAKILGREHENVD